MELKQIDRGVGTDAGRDGAAGAGRRLLLRPRRDAVAAILRWPPAPGGDKWPPESEE
jgi:hypothetical protein